MLRFAKFDNIFGHRNRWTFHPSRSLTEGSSNTEQKTSGDSPASEPNQRETSEQDESYTKRVNKKFKCPTEPFLETLKLLDEYF